MMARGWMAAAWAGFMLRNTVETNDTPSARRKAEDVAADRFFGMGADPVCGWRRMEIGRFDHPRNARIRADRGGIASVFGGEGWG